MVTEEEEGTGLMYEDDTCIAEEMRLKAEAEEQARLKSSLITQKLSRNYVQPGTKWPKQLELSPHPQNCAL